MRLIEEIPPAVLRRFAVACAKRGFDYLEQRHPVDARILQCIRAAEGFLDGTLAESELREGRRAAGAVVAEAAIGPDTARVAAAALAASSAANGDAASWTAAAAEAAHAAHSAADAIDAADALTGAYRGIHNVARGFAAADAADRAATAARTAAASGAVAHAAGVAAASGTYAPDTAADRYFAAWSASTTQPADGHYLAQNENLLELIAASRANRVQSTQPEPPGARHRPTEKRARFADGSTVRAGPDSRNCVERIAESAPITGTGPRRDLPWLTQPTRRT